MIPLRDAKPLGRFPVVCFCLICLNVLVWGYWEFLASSTEWAFFQYGLLPGRFLSAHGRGRMLSDAIVPLFTCMFMHVGFWHLVVNCWVLWLFGENVEHRLGRVLFLLFYVVCGVTAGLVHVWLQPNSGPVCGASIAIWGVLAAYLILFPRGRVRALFVTGLVSAPSYVFIAIYMLVPFVRDFALGMDPPPAHVAHVAGFLTGLLLVLVAKKILVADRD